MPFVVLACAATFARDGRVDRRPGRCGHRARAARWERRDSAVRRRATRAALLAAAILPLAIAYSVDEALGYEAGLDDCFAEARTFYCTYAGLVAIAAGTILILGVPLIPIPFLTQALNAILLPPLLVLMPRMARDLMLMGRWRSERAAAVAYTVTIAVVVASVVALAVSTIST